MFARLTPTVKNILIINIVIFLAQSVIKIDFPSIFGLRVVFADTFAIFQVFTYMWIHSNFYHLFSNMFAVFMFGPLLESFFGSKKFLTFYLITGIGAGIFFGIADFIEKYPMKKDLTLYVENPNPESFNIFLQNYSNNITNLSSFYTFSDAFFDHPYDENYISESISYLKMIYQLKVNIPMVGASGSVFGILMAFAMLFPNLELYLLFPPIPIKAKYLVLFYGAYELYSEINQSPDDNVAHLAHLGGMLIAFLLIKYWKTNKFY